MSPLAGKTILLTGGTGFIGRHLASRIEQIAGARLVLLSRHTESNTDQRVTRIARSLEQLERRTWLDHGINHVDIVFHLGAFAPKKAGEGDAMDAVFDANVAGTRALLDSLSNVPERIIFASTVDVYGPLEDGDSLTESSPLAPSTLYGASKLFGEHMIRVFARQSGCGYAVLRYGHLYGPGEGAYAKFIPQVIKTMLGNQSPTLYGDGSARRDFMFVGDAVEATLRAANSPRREIDAVNVVSGQSRSIRELAGILSRLVGFPGDIKYLPERPGGASLDFENARMLDVLGQWEFCPLEEGLQQEIDYFRSLQ